MKKLVVIAALALALTGAAAHVSYAGPCADANCTPSESNKTRDTSKPSGDAKEPCSDANCRKDERDDHRAAKDAAKEAARAAAKAIFEAVKARNSSKHSRAEDDKQSN